jgi:tetratricopeptide (TPR) repeat protein
MMTDQRTHAATTESTSLLDWGQAMDRALRLGQPQRVPELAQVVFHRLPRHLATYARLLDAWWEMGAWAEGATWARRLLQADPGNAKAWRALARHAENRGERALAESMWQRTFEHAPFDADARAGLARTSLDRADPLRLNPACLAALRMRSFHWGQAAAVYRPLAEAAPQRLDYVVGYMLALWRHGQLQTAYGAARFLVRKQPYVLPAWIVVAAVGDENDRALAQSPRMTMDPDGEYMTLRLGLELAPPAERRRFGVAYEPYMLTVTPQEKALLV